MARPAKNEISDGNLAAAPSGQVFSQVIATETEERLGLLVRQFGWNRWSYWLSREWLLSPFMLKALLWINFLGTVYGYYWYGSQLEYTIDHYPVWMSFLVPDSPTASLFFTAAVWWLYKNPEQGASGKALTAVRSFVETFAVVTSVKYGIWAVAMIFAGAAQGDPLAWQDWMLSASHLGMAAEALLYARFFRIGRGSILAVAVWTLYNDFADYGYQIFPWLPDELYDNLGAIQLFTVLLSIFSLVSAWAVCRVFRKSTV